MLHFLPGSHRHSTPVPGALPIPWTGPLIGACGCDRSGGAARGRRARRGCSGPRRWPGRRRRSARCARPGRSDPPGPAWPSAVRWPSRTERRWLAFSSMPTTLRSGPGGQRSPEAGRRLGQERRHAPVEDAVGLVHLPGDREAQDHPLGSGLEDLDVEQLVDARARPSGRRRPSRAGRRGAWSPPDANGRTVNLRPVPDVVDLRSDTVTQPDAGHAPGHGRRRGGGRRLRGGPDRPGAGGGVRGTGGEAGRALRALGHHGQPDRRPGAGPRRAPPWWPAAASTWWPTSTARPPVTPASSSSRVDDGDGMLDADDVRWASQASAYHQPAVSLVSIENTHMAASGAPWSLDRPARRGRGGRRRARPPGRRPALQRRGGHRGAGRRVGRAGDDRDVLPVQGALRAGGLAAGRPGRRDRRGPPGAQAAGWRHAPSRGARRAGPGGPRDDGRRGSPRTTPGRPAWPRRWRSAGRDCGLDPASGAHQHRDLRPRRAGQAAGPPGGPRGAGRHHRAADRAPGHPSRRGRRRDRRAVAALADAPDEGGR